MPTPAPTAVSATQIATSATAPPVPPGISAASTSMPASDTTGPSSSTRRSAPPCRPELAMDPPVQPTAISAAR